MEFDIDSVGCLLATQDGRYLLQLRDNRRNLALRDHWVLFGGRIEPGETPERSLRRELREELEFELRQARWYHEAIYALPRANFRIVRRVYFVVTIDEKDIASMTLREGVAMRLFKVREVLALPRVSPWDLGTIVMHARSNELFEHA